jgi:hypothetical protein
MFHLCAEPLLLSQAGIQGLCLSLNTPVLNIDELPVEPAQAAIVLFDDGYGTLSLGVGVKSLETRRSAVFVYRGLVDETQNPGETMNGALVFAEGMGFLFDEDVVSADAVNGRARALSLWTDLTADGEALPDPPAAEPDADVAQAPLAGPPPAAQLIELDDLLDEPSGELVLEDLEQRRAVPDESLEVVEFAPPVASADASPPEPIRGPAPQPVEVGVEPVSRHVPLSKFRQPPPPPPAFETGPDLLALDSDQAGPPLGDQAGSALGRIAIVRKEVGAAEERPGLLMRILSSF